MDLDLSPKLPSKIYGGEGGSYYAWSPDELPMLQKGNIGAAKFALKKNRLALPRNSDSHKLAYVLDGSGVARIILPEKDEKVLPIKKGDAIANPFGVFTWWYNNEDTDLVILLLGTTKIGHQAGRFTDFFLTGSNGIFTGFSTEFFMRAWNLEESIAKSLVGSQPRNGIVKVVDSAKMPEPKPKQFDRFALNCIEAPLDVDIKGGGKVVVLNTKNLPFIRELGFRGDLVSIQGSPGFSCDYALQVTYIVPASERVQIVGVEGERVLEVTIEAVLRNSDI